MPPYGLGIDITRTRIWIDPGHFAMEEEGQESLFTLNVAETINGNVENTLYEPSGRVNLADDNTSFFYYYDVIINLIFDDNFNFSFIKLNEA